MPLRAESLDALSRLERALRESVLCGTQRTTFALAYSGGLDSRFLAFAAQRLGFHPVLLHVCGPHVSRQETAYARDWAAAQNLPYEEVDVNPLALPLVAAGDKRRCYACKHALFSRLKERTPHPLCDGTNASDSTGYRPGMQAIRELDVLSPLALAGLGKPAIHTLAADMGMTHPEQKPRPCLLTRLPYGLSPQKEVLAMLDDGEQAVRRVLAAAGLPEAAFRLRLVAPGRPELHMETASGSLSPALRQSLVETVRRTVPALPPFPIVLMDTLSGFFDSQPTPDAGSPA